MRYSTLTHNDKSLNHFIDQSENIKKKQNDNQLFIKPNKLAISNQDSEFLFKNSRNTDKT